MEMELKAGFTREDYELFTKMDRAGVTASTARKKANQIFDCSCDDVTSMEVELDGGTIDFGILNHVTDERLAVFLQPDEAQRLHKLLGELIEKSGVEF